MCDGLYSMRAPSTGITIEGDSDHCTFYL